jgi:hypothetical protein
MANAAVVAAMLRGILRRRGTAVVPVFETLYTVLRIRYGVVVIVQEERAMSKSDRKLDDV